MTDSVYLCPEFTEAHARRWRTMFLQASRGCFHASVKGYADLSFYRLFQLTGLSGILNNMRASDTRLSTPRIYLKHDSEFNISDARCMETKSGAGFFIKTAFKPNSYDVGICYDPNSAMYSQSYGGQALACLASDLCCSEFAARINKNKGKRVEDASLVTDFLNKVNLPVTKAMSVALADINNGGYDPWELNALVQREIDRLATSAIRNPHDRELRDSEVYSRLDKLQDGLQKNRPSEVEVCANPEGMDMMNLECLSDGWVPVGLLSYEGRRGGTAILRDKVRGNKYEVSNSLDTGWMKALVKDHVEMLGSTAWASCLTIPKETFRNILKGAH